MDRWPKESWFNSLEERALRSAWITRQSIRRITRQSRLRIVRIRFRMHAYAHRLGLPG